MKNSNFFRDIDKLEVFEFMIKGLKGYNLLFQVCISDCANFAQLYKAS